MGLLDFFHKGKEKPVQRSAVPQAQAAPAAPAAAPAGAAPRTYTAKAGDSLSLIAKQFYGDAHQWSRIYDANRALIANPDGIQPGWELTIPAEIFGLIISALGNLSRINVATLDGSAPSWSAISIQL